MDSFDDKSSQESAPAASVLSEKSGWNKPLPEKIPRPTYWPFVLALGIMLMAMGVVTNYAVSAVGFILLVIALVGWIGELQHGE